MRKATGVEPKLVRGDEGIFDVEVDGVRIFSKHDVGRFPEDAEVLAKLPKKPVTPGR